MTINYKVYFFFISCSLIIISFVQLNSIFLLSGDEFFTLDIKNINKPIPYKLIVSIIINFLEPITSKDVITLRLTSLFFIILTIFSWFFSFLKSKNEVFIFFLIMISSSFVAEQSIFFRYYSYYFLSSSVIFFSLVYFSTRLTINQKLLVGIVGTVLSPYLFFILNTLF